MMVALQQSNQTSPAGDSAPWPQEWDLVVMSMLASGLVELDRALDRRGAFPVPYPVPLQRSLDRLSAMGAAAGKEAPRSVMDLVSWAHLPFGRWPFRPGVEAMGDEETMLLWGKPTQTCLEWAVFSGDVEGEVRERLRIQGVLDVCKAHGSPETYVAFRQLLVEQPAMSARDLALALADPELALVANHVHAAYQAAPAEALVDGEAVICGGCGHLWRLDEYGVRRCQEWDCPAPSTMGARLPAVEGVVCLSRELRAFVSGPGRVELRIARKLRDAGLNVRLWPEFDACDVFPVEVPWAADVKAWLNPVRLARHLSEHPFRPPADAERGFIVIADEQITGRPEYLRVLRNHCDLPKGYPRIEVVTEKTYVTRVIRQALGVRR
jgi:hypothetical protein